MAWFRKRPEAPAQRPAVKMPDMASFLMAVEGISGLKPRLVWLAISTRLSVRNHPAGPMTSADLYVLSDRIGRLAHQVAREEDEKWAAFDKTMREVNRLCDEVCNEG